MRRILSLILIASIALLSTLSLSSCNEACDYFAERNISGRDIKYAKISFERYGDVYLLLDATTAPITVKNFLRLAADDFYDGLTIHRVISDFMIQGGDPNGDGTGGSKTKIYGEFESNGYTKNDILHLRGVISMARSQNSNNSASSQFFICTYDYPSLDGEYAAFGYVIAGMNVVDKISKDTVKFTKNDGSGLVSDVSKRAVIITIDEVNSSEALAAAK